MRFFLSDYIFFAEMLKKTKPLAYAIFIFHFIASITKFVLIYNCTILGAIWDLTIF